MTKLSNKVAPGRMSLEQAARQALEALREYRDTQMISAPRKSIEALREALAEQAECKECGAKQAQIDRLMLEYCPDEMTHEQMQEWGNNQRPAKQAEQEPVAWMDADGWVTKSKVAAILRGGEWTELYAAPVRTKDLTDEELWEAAKTAKSNDLTDAFRAVIAADREKNK